MASLFVSYLHGRSALSAGMPSRSADSAVIFIIQGISPADLKLARTPNISALAAQGASYTDAWVGQAEAYPATSIATIATGAYSRQHGLIGPAWLDSQSGSVAQIFQPQQVLQGSLDQALQARGLTPLPQVVKAHDPHARVLSVGGEGCGGASAAGTWAADYVLCPVRSSGQWSLGSVAGHSLPTASMAKAPGGVAVATGVDLAPSIEGWQAGQQDDWVARTSVWAMQQIRPRLTIVTFPEIAQLGRYAPVDQRQQIVAQLVAGVDRDIGQILDETRREGNAARTLFVVTSDRPSALIQTRIPRSALTAAVVGAGGQSVYISTDMSAAIGVKDPLQSQPVAQAMQAQRNRGVDAVYYKTQQGSTWTYEAQYLNPDLPSGFENALGYLLWTFASGVSPDVVVAYAPGTGTGTRLFGFDSVAGGMGFQWETQRIPLILSGAGIAPARSSTYPARLVDIAPTVETIMGLQIPHLDGVVLADSLFVPDDTAIQRQKNTAKWLSPLVKVLKQRQDSAVG